MPAYARYTLAEFAQTDPDAVRGRLAAGHAGEGYATQRRDAVDAWDVQVDVLQRMARELLQVEPLGTGWHVLLEYPIPRRARRVDAVLLAGDVIGVLELKTGRGGLTAADRRQVEDYALDLRDFHVASRGRVILPVLLTPQDTPRVEASGVFPGEVVQRVHVLAGPSIAQPLAELVRRHRRIGAEPIEAASWDLGEYRPVPTIIEAAQHLYANHSVHDIARSHAGAENLTATAEAVLRVIADAHRDRGKVICFVTGVPGAGKTLAGLNIVHARGLHQDRDTLGVFLSGNGPLVRVLTEALAQDRAGRLGERVGDARRRVTTFIQNVHRFLPAHSGSDAPMPPENVVVFDEAQRAWDLEQSRRKFNRDLSEPEQLLGVMDRLDWAVVVALVGNGQEINTGEAGLPEWGRVLRERFPNWQVRASSAMLGTTDGAFPPLFAEGTGDVLVGADPRLHLSIPLRSFRAEAYANWVEAVLAGDAPLAASLRETMPDFPLALTRDLEAARYWLRCRARGLRRAGLIASSGSRRLRPYGLDVTAELDEAQWFLQPVDDVRSSSFLELVATEFAVQGLELDWVGLGWDADLRRVGDLWSYHRFVGTCWQRVANATRQRYLLNKYRVLLTRAREGLVVWVPPGSSEDQTRPPEHYDETAAYLAACGVDELDS